MTTAQCPEEDIQAACMNFLESYAAFCGVPMRMLLGQDLETYWADLQASLEAGVLQARI